MFTMGSMQMHIPERSSGLVPRRPKLGTPGPHAGPALIPYQVRGRYDSHVLHNTVDRSADIIDASPLQHARCQCRWDLRRAKEGQSLELPLPTANVEGVPSEACELRATVDGDDVTVLEYDFRGRGYRAPHGH